MESEAEKNRPAHQQYQTILLLTHTIAFEFNLQGGERFRLLVSFSPVLLGAAWDIGRFYLPGTYQKALGFQPGVLLFIFLQTIYLVRSYKEGLRSSGEL